MNAVLQGQLSRIETALNTLIDSISAYTPSTQAAVALLEADDDFCKGLEQLTIHQTNYARIQSLTQTADSLSAQLTQSLSLLARTRAELLATPFTAISDETQRPEDHRRDVPYAELLSYAKRISKFTAPPGFRAPIPPPPPTSSTNEASAGIAGPDPSTANGVSLVVNGEKASIGGLDAKEGGVGLASLPPEELQWFSRAQNLAFTPWPSADTIRRGGLAGIQAMIDAGKDPATVTLADSGVVAAEESGSEMKVEGQGVTGEGTSTGIEPASSQTSVPAKDEAAFPVAPPPAPVVKEEKPAVFGGLDLYDPEDD
ncbi:MAG: hypothetical protein M4579_000772 [Chaenotheca gracillima]|nr:MAG: hypothetical protein M4579_000772 [Chaenotheca gracillima]